MNSAQQRLKGEVEKGILADARRLLVDVAADQEVTRVAHHYGITPVFAGVFGSRAKGYNGPQSDFDLYIPYVGKLGQYVRALDIDTSQIDGEPVLPPQITVEVIPLDGRTYSVQLNFVSLDHFIQELTRNNIDFRIALDNILLTYCNKAFIDQLGWLTTIHTDLENIKNKALGRASKTAALLKRSDLGRIKPSEVTDGIYRLLLAAATVTDVAIPQFFYFRTLTIEYLLSNYIAKIDRQDVLAKGILEGILSDIERGVWKHSYVQWAPNVILLIDRLIPVIKELPTTRNTLVDCSMAAHFSMVSSINKAYQELVLKAHTTRSLL